MSKPPHPILDRSEKLPEKLEQLGFKCLDDKWQGWQAKYRFRCANGHELLASIGSIKKMIGCRFCRAEASWQKLLRKTRQINVKCHDSHWISNHTYYRFSCMVCGHEWRRIGNYAQRDSSCPRCARARTGLKKRHPDGLERLQRAAASKGGTCLSEEYRGVDYKHRFRCKEGHIWDSAGIKIINGSWCPVCAVKETTLKKKLPNGLEILQSIVEGYGGELLTKKYTGMSSRYHLRCNKGHEWRTTGSILQQGGWCRQCFEEYRQQQIMAQAHELAEARGGKCLSTAYRSTKEKWHWLCHCGHSWHAVLASIRMGHWCPTCSIIGRIRKPGSKAWLKYIRI